MELKEYIEKFAGMKRLNRISAALRKNSKTTKPGLELAQERRGDSLHMAFLRQFDKVRRRQGRMGHIARSNDELRSFTGNKEMMKYRKRGLI